LIRLPDLPNRLKIINFYNNKITELPELPNRLEELYCNYNPIKFITPDIYTIMKCILLINKQNIFIDNTIFYDQSGCSSKTEFFGCADECDNE